MHLANLSESFVDDLVELSWAQSHCRKKNRQQRLLSIKLPFPFLIFVGASPCSVVESCLHMLFLINCIYSVIVDIKCISAKSVLTAVPDDAVRTNWSLPGLCPSAVPGICHTEVNLK